MSQSQLDHAVARATGESLSTIRRMGFSAFDPWEADDHDTDAPCVPPNIVDWDALDAERARSAA